MTFDDDDVVRSLDLKVEPGSIVGLIGPSGCGKTTTVRILTGLLTPTSGTATIDGVPAHHLTAKQRTRIGYLPQSPALFSDLSVWENLNFHASMYGLALRRRKRLRQLLDWVELSDDSKKRVRDTSGGMQRRLALAATFVHDPSFLFLDEPTAGIDPILREKFWTQFRTLASEGRTLLVTTQYVGEASFCDYVGLLSDGELLMFDTPQNLRRAAFDGEVIDVVLQRAPVRRAAGRASPTCRSSSARSNASTRHRAHRRARRRRGDRRDRRLSWTRSGSRSSRPTEHVVDYDEAFVRVVERHRASTADSGGSAGVSVDELQETAEPTPPAVAPPATARMRRAHGPWRWLIRSQTFVRKELAEILRQPRLLALLVVGPFVLLLLFGTGFSQDAIRLRTAVRRPGGLGLRGDARIVRAMQLDEFVDSQGLVNDKEAALRDARLRRRRSRGRVPRRSALGGAGGRERDDRGVQPGDGPHPADGHRDRRADGGAGGERDGAVDDRHARRRSGSLPPRRSPTTSSASPPTSTAVIPPIRRWPNCSAPSQTQLDDLDSVIDGSINLLDRLAPEAADTAGLLEARATVEDLRTPGERRRDVRLGGLPRRRRDPDRQRQPGHHRRSGRAGATLLRRHGRA